MTHLISAILAISLCALLLVGGVNYLTSGTGQRIEAEAMVSSGIVSLGTAFSAYRIANRMVPPTSGAPDAWRDELFPHYATEPRTPPGLEWSYGEDSRGWWFCLSGNAVGVTEYRGISSAAKRHEPSVVEIRNLCEGGVIYTPSAFPASVALIYRVMDK